MAPQRSPAKVCLRAAQAELRNRRLGPVELNFFGQQTALGSGERRYRDSTTYLKL